MRRTLVAVLSLVPLLFLACGGSKGTPTAPSTPPPTPTKIISVSGDLSFGTVNLGSSADRSMTITNGGNTALTVTSISVTGASGTLTASWTSGTIAAGTTQNVTVRFTPTADQSYSGVMTVGCDSTSGNNTINWSGRGFNSAPLWTKTGVGDTVFDMPTTISRVKITGDYTSHSSNFIVHIGGHYVVNELLGTSWGQTHFEGTYLTTGGVTEILSSSGVSWSFTEVRSSGLAPGFKGLVDR